MRRLRPERSASAEPLRVPVLTDVALEPGPVGELREADVERVVIDIGSPGREEALPLLDQLAASLLDAKSES